MVEALIDGQGEGAYVVENLDPRFDEIVIEPGSGWRRPGNPKKPGIILHLDANTGLHLWVLQEIAPFETRELRRLFEKAGGEITDHFSVHRSVIIESLSIPGLRELVKRTCRFLAQDREERRLPMVRSPWIEEILAAGGDDAKLFCRSSSRTQSLQIMTLQGIDVELTRGQGRSYRVATVWKNVDGGDQQIPACLQDCGFDRLQTIHDRSGPCAACCSARFTGSANALLIWLRKMKEKLDG